MSVRVLTFSQTNFNLAFSLSILESARCYGLLLYERLSTMSFQYIICYCNNDDIHQSNTHLFSI